MWIDSHCHLNHDRNKDGETPASMVARAKANGVEGMVNICCRVADEFPLILQTAQSLENVWCTVGTHPHDAGKDAEKAITQQQLVDFAQSDDKVIGIGESGLDYFYDSAPIGDQKESFRKHIRACIETGLPLIVHTRDADEDTMTIIQEEGDGTKLKGLLHCFSSGRKLAEEALEFGFYISLSGIVTFKQATELQDVAKDIPLERVLVETDAPFLAPVPLRGKINEPANVVHTGAFLAKLKGISQESMASHSKNNFFTLFEKARKTYDEKSGQI